MTTPVVSVIIPTIPGRERLLQRAVESVHAQKVLDPYTDVEVLVVRDDDGEGPAVMRNRALSVAESPWVAFLDDDDAMKPSHLAMLLSHAHVSGADLVYPWFDYVINGRIRNGQSPLRFNGRDPMGHTFNAAARRELRRRNFIPVTTLVRSEVLRHAGGFVVPHTDEWPHADCEDWGTWLRLLDAGATFSHLPHRTWDWHIHAGNTAGRPERVKRTVVRGG